MRLDDADDDRVAPYRSLIASDRAGTGDRLPGRFVAEGARTVTQVLELGWPVESLLVSERRWDAYRGLVSRAASSGTAVYTAEQAVMDRVAGFNIHRGLLAVVRRPPPRSVDELARRPGTLLGVEAVNDLENLGALFRNAAAFAAAGVVLDPTAADPLYRRSVRVSVGHVLTVPFARVASWPEGLVRACSATGRRIVALTPGGSSTLDELAARASANSAWAVLVGAEGDGLSATSLAAADVTARIPIAAGVDSLNVATAAAIALHRLAGAATL